MRIVSRKLLVASALFGLCGPAHADSAPAPKEHGLLHAPPSQTALGRPLRLVAVVTDEWTDETLLLRYRPAGAGAFQQVRFERTPRGSYDAVVPADQVRAPGLEYYIAAASPGGGEKLRFASPEHPQRVQVTVPEGERWAVAERGRLHGHLSEIDVEARAMQFGNRFGYDDYFARGEISFAHRLLTHLYSIRLGYGAITGKTPDGRDAMSTSVRRAGRYGFGQVRLRLLRGVWVDGKAAVGFDREGFIVGGGGALTLGAPWRTAVQVGAEAFQGLSGTYWLRLQWDSVPPFLMGATVARTDLPGAPIKNGAYVSYDARFPITERFDLGGWVAAGTRDGPTRFGAGLETHVRF